MKKNAGRIVIFGLLAFLWTLTESHAATYYVGPDGNDTASGAESDPWKTLQYAVNQAVDGDSILLQPGIFSEHVVINRSGITISGSVDSSGALASILEGTPSGTGIKLDRVQGVALRDLVVKDQTYGIDVAGGSGNTIDHVVIQDIQANGRGIQAMGSSNLSIKNCSVNRYPWPIQIYFSPSCMGIYASGSSGLLLEGNDVNDIGYTTYNPSVMGGPYATGVSGHGIWLNDCSNARILRNNVIGRGSHSFILQYSSVVEMKQNKIAGGLTALYVANGTTIASFEQNRIQGSDYPSYTSTLRGYGLVVYDGSSRIDAMIHNLFVKSTLGWEIYNQGVIGVSEYNYYGSPNEASIQAAFVGTVPFIPYRIMPPNIYAHDFLFPTEPPAQLTAVAAPSGVQLAWTRPTQMALIGGVLGETAPVTYRIYRRTDSSFAINYPSGTVNGELIGVTEDTSFLDKNGLPNAVYYYAVTAVLDGNESVFSPVSAATMPLYVTRNYDSRHWYVDASVEESGDGSASAPFKTMADAIAVLGPEQTIHIAAGEYNESFSISNDNVKLIGETAPGSEARPVLSVGSQNLTVTNARGVVFDNIAIVAGDHSGGVVLYAENAHNLCLRNLSVESDRYNVTIRAVDARGLTMENVTLNSRYYYGVTLVNCAYSRIRNNRMICGDYTCLSLYGCNNSLVEGNSFKAPNWHGMIVYASSHRVKILNNTVESCSWNGIYLEDVNDIQIIGNVIKGCGGANANNNNGAIVFDNSHCALVMGNTLTGNRRGVTVTQGSLNASVLFNTITGNTSEGILVQTTGATGLRMAAFNNFSGNGGVNIQGGGLENYVRYNYYGTTTPAQFKLSAVEDTIAAALFAATEIPLDGRFLPVTGLAAVKSSQGSDISWNSDALKLAAQAVVMPGGSTVNGYRALAVEDGATYKVFRSTDAAAFPPSDQDATFPASAEQVAVLQGPAAEAADIPSAPGTYYYSVMMEPEQNPSANSWVLGPSQGVTYEDSDADGINDEYETVVLHSNPQAADTDDDGYDDYYEWTHGTDMNIADSDNDGLSNDEEIQTADTDPLVADTDRDGWKDGVDPDPKSRAWIDWGNAEHMYNVNHLDYYWPAWCLDAWVDVNNGYLNTDTSTYNIDAVKPTYAGAAVIRVNNTLLGGQDLRLVTRVSTERAGFFYVQLRNDQDAIVVNNASYPPYNAGFTGAVDTMILPGGVLEVKVPLSAAPAATKILLHRYTGNVTHYESQLFVDANGDGFEDSQIAAIDADPQADRDEDGIADGWEYRMGLDFTRNDSAEDPDGDGQPNLQEYQTGTDPLKTAGEGAKEDANLRKLGGGSSHSAAVKDDGTVWSWGAWSLGQLGNGQKVNYLTSQWPPLDLANFQARPVQSLIPGNPEIVEVSPSQYHTLALDVDGNVYAWGGNQWGDLGLGCAGGNTNFDARDPFRMPGLPPMRKIAAGNYHNAGIDMKGQVWTWGSGWEGQLGTGSGAGGAKPSATTLKDVVSISMGIRHGLALKKNGEVWAWGWNKYGQVGNNSTNNQMLPVRVMFDAVAIAAGGQFSMVLDLNSNVWVWGDGTYGQMGNGAFIANKTPVKVTGLSNVIRIDAGGSSAYALTANGTLYAWGNGGNGQLGDNNSVSKAIPTPISALSADSGMLLGAGATHGLILHSNGDVKSWGVDHYRQLGQASSTLTPGLIHRKGVEDVAASEGTIFNVKN